MFLFSVTTTMERKKKKEKERLVVTVATTRKQTPPNFDYVTVTSLFRSSTAIIPWRGSKRVAWYVLSVLRCHYTIRSYAAYCDHFVCSNFPNIGVYLLQLLLCIRETAASKFRPKPGNPLSYQEELG
jgi:hypothetical protein